MDTKSIWSSCKLLMDIQPNISGAICQAKQVKEIQKNPEGPQTAITIMSVCKPLTRVVCPLCYIF